MYERLPRLVNCEIQYPQDEFSSALSDSQNKCTL